jgi:hypothetical protein
VGSRYFLQEAPAHVGGARTVIFHALKSAKSPENRASITSPEQVLDHLQCAEHGDGEQIRHRPGRNVVREEPDRDGGQDREADADMEPETVPLGGGDGGFDAGW